MAFNLVPEDTNGPIDVFVAVNPLSPLLTLSVGDVSVDEAVGSAIVTITLERVLSATPVTVSYTIANGTAVFSEDYNSTSSTVNQERSRSS